MFGLSKCICSLFCCLRFVHSFSTRHIASDALSVDSPNFHARMHFFGRRKLPMYCLVEFPHVSNIFFDCVAFFAFLPSQPTSYMPFMPRKKSIIPVKTTSKIPPPGPNLSTLGMKPLYSAPKPSSLKTVPRAGKAQLYLGT